MDKLQIAKQRLIYMIANPGHCEQSFGICYTLQHNKHIHADIKIHGYAIMEYFCSKLGYRCPAFPIVSDPTEDPWEGGNLERRISLMNDIINEIDKGEATYETVMSRYDIENN